MRNLKRVLALAMALVMTLGMMVIGANAASYADADQISDNYAEAVEVLTGMGVFQGMDTGAFAPKEVLTRAQASALVYRVLTADVTDAKKDLYDYTSFDDVKEGQWFTGYITYAANGGYVKGYGDGTFAPNDKVTGVQVLAIMLRAMGYGQNGEFEGAAWKDNTLTKAHDLHLLDNINVTSSDDLDKPATRELVAQILFDAIQADTTAYTPAFGYYPNNLQSLGKKNFGLTGPIDTQDVWGRPGYKYTYTTGDKSTSFTYEPTKTYTTAVTECDVASAVGNKTTKTYTTYTNGIGNAADKVINPIATASKIGAQGRLTEIYQKQGIIVYIDTYLAQVADVKAATFDAAGHLKTSSSLTLDVWTDKGIETVTLYGGDKNYSYTKNQMLLVNAVDSANGYIATKTGTYGTTPSTLEIVKAPDSIVGAQAVIWFNADQHTVNGTTYNDSHTFYLDEVGTETINHTWYFDQYGNLIGVTDIDTVYSYGVLTSLYWVNDGSNYGAGAAYATITYMDGTASGIVEIAKVDGLPTAYARNTAVGPYDADSDSINDIYYVSTYGNDNAGLLLNDLYRIETQANGTLLLDACAKTTGTNSAIETGVSAVTDTDLADAGLYGDNFTQYLTYNPVTKTFNSVTGYENIGDYTNVNFSYVNNANNTFLKYVYIKAAPDAAGATSFVFITNTGASVTLKKLGGVDYYSVSGVVRADGSTDPVVVKADAYGSAAATLTALRDWIDNGVGQLYAVTTANNVVVNDTSIALVTDLGIVNTPFKAVYAGVPTNYTSNGVLNVGGVHYNVNSTTTILTEAGRGTTADLTAAVVNGKYVYVVYKTAAPTTATTVFISDVPGTVVADAQLAAAKAAAVQALRDYAAATVDSAYINSIYADLTVADIQTTLDAQINAVNACTTEAAIDAIIDVDATPDGSMTGVAALDAAAIAAATAAAAAAAVPVVGVDGVINVASTGNPADDNTLVLGEVRLQADGVYQVTGAMAYSGADTPDTLLYFKITNVDANSIRSLIIKDSTGRTVYNETDATATRPVGPVTCYVNIKPASNFNASIVPAGDQNEGVGDMKFDDLTPGTYTYIFSCGTSTITGTFTVR